MLTKLLRSSKYLYSSTNFIRIYCNITSSDVSIVKIDDKCYIPVPCPKPTQFDSENKYIRLTRGEPSKVRLGFIPDEWFNFFGQKTGITGPYAFIISLSTFLISKEIYVMEHEYYTLLSVIILLWTSSTLIGPHIAKSLDKAIDEYENEWTLQRTAQTKFVEESMQYENKMQQSMEGQLTLQDAKKENIQLQLEAVYRERLFTVYKDVKKRLDFQIMKPIIFTSFIHKNLIEWIIKQVTASYTDEKDKQMIDICINHLTTLSKNVH